MNSRPKYLMRSHRAQQGIVLFISLIILLLVTLLAVAGVRTVTVEERMNAATYDRAIAFQAAERALRLGEGIAQAHAGGGPSTVDLPVAGQCVSSGNFAGICRPPAVIPAGYAPWLDASLRTATGPWQAVAPEQGADAGSQRDSLIGAQSQVLVEYLGANFQCHSPEDIALMPVPPAANCRRYRITALTELGDGRANVMLQSIFATEP